MWCKFSSRNPRWHWEGFLLLYVMNYLTGLQSAQIREDIGPKWSLKMLRYGLRIDFPIIARSSLSVQMAGYKNLCADQTEIAWATLPNPAAARAAIPIAEPRFWRQKASPAVSTPLVSDQRLVCSHPIAPKRTNPHFQEERTARQKPDKSATRQSILRVCVCVCVWELCHKKKIDSRQCTPAGSCSHKYQLFIRLK